jgi:cystathionine beta-synthase
MVREKDGGAPEALISVAPETPVRRALAFVTEQYVSQLPVLTDGDCVGHVSEATLMARVIEDTAVLDRSVQELMDAPFPVVDSHVDLATVTRLLTRRNPAVLVRHGGDLAAILTRHDVLRYLTTSG